MTFPRPAPAWDMTSCGMCGRPATDWYVMRGDTVRDMPGAPGYRARCSKHAWRGMSIRTASRCSLSEALVGVVMRS